MRVFRDALNGEYGHASRADVAGKADADSIAPAPAGPYV
jgi:hypothetical protein